MRLAIVLGGIAAAALFLFMFFTGYNNAAVRMEESVIAAHDDSRNVLAQYAPKINDALGVTTVQADALQKLFEGANESRYGADGSKAVAQFIQEQNPNLDQSNYGRIINMIEAGRNDFQAAQKDKIERVRIYRTKLNEFPGGAIMKFMGFPKPTEDGTPFFKAYGAIVVSGHADKAFKTGIDDGLGIGKPAPAATAN